MSAAPFEFLHIAARLLQFANGDPPQLSKHVQVAEIVANANAGAEAGLRLWL